MSSQNRSPDGLFMYLPRRIQMTQPTSAKSDNDNKVEILAQSNQPKRKSILLFALFALMLNGAAAVSTLPSFDINMPNISLAGLFPHETASAPIPDSVVAALKDIQSAQAQHVAALQENGSSLQQNTASLQQNTALLQQDTITLDSLRQGFATQQTDVKKISNQLSVLMAKVDTLQNKLMSDITASIPQPHGRNRLSRRARMMGARQPKPVGLVSVGGAPLISAPATGWARDNSDTSEAGQ
jgi:TolA-binding protein